MDVITPFSFLFATPTIIFSCLSQIYLWQLKEYRWDRLRVALGDRPLSLPLVFLYSAYALTLAAWLFDLPLLALVAIMQFFLLYLWRTFTLGIYRPQWTTKARLIGLVDAVYLLLLWAFTLLSAHSPSVKLALLIVLVVPLTALSVGLVNLLTHSLKQRTIARSKDLRQSLGQLTVIGITGSYGKTTTKHILSHLIPSATVSLEHRNSAYVIALDMLQQLTSATKIYIVEMSAYRPGEIAKLAALTKPTLGTITHLGNQHLALFGSVTSLVRTKWELITALPKNGIAVLNADDPRQVAQARSFKGLTRWYSTSQPADVYADQISILPDKINFCLHLSSHSFPVSIPLLSEAYLSSVLAALATASAIGLSADDIVSRLSSITPYPRTMELVAGRSGASIIDDSYSANEQSVLNAIRHLQRFPQTDRRIIMVPLIELGGSSRAVHQRLGQALKDSGAQVFVYGQARHNDLKQPYFTNPDLIIKLACQNLTANTVILLEGRIPHAIRHALINKDPNLFK
ncbi:MAG: hypothetical protein A3E37_05575 [Candidatus Andersenbacteria bacterium RIFCSPHIGHO2_12_FULL_46_9]|nr:MAG: UDP-N-acetylmuramoyl-tripeptide-D-alanyl-D-alanine ligase [Parcubacteria group bacterium GW2011_GWA2_45_14]OGY33721.1 MAG: hypothetical protein A3B76_02570 [Candidatus Andersenbacteria bacterium RIFCSPHIGHO2_02_FULL_46_16]OGY36155.1 MAG: hypothetical protein A3I08_04880 [Candidatus Andersenbacteria bacterium RIFCSPLOWO2_02_FULL_46_11]OGY38038.1 MAG: hypothetical protein A3E37_05575 [Candidatus Andersenbacteria bacterium RIFCSPHIGHO2_12_FULL_46_9]OGY42749.1 MAG: hypothetical protein A3G5